MGVTTFFVRLMNKAKQELFRLQKPKLWGRNCQLNGIPTIYAIDKLDIGKDVSLNSGVVIQCSGGGTNRQQSNYFKGCSYFDGWIRY